MKILLIIVVGCLFCNSLLWARQHDGVGTSVLSPRTSLSGNSLEMELEKSLDVPADIKTDILVDMLDEVLLRFVAEEEIKCWKEVRQFTYFDTPEDSLMRQGITLRVVTGFSPDDGDGEGLYRYDYKLGEKGTEARREGSYWSNRELSYEEIKRQFNLAPAQALEIAAIADSRQIKRKVIVGDTHLGISFDMFFVAGEKVFQELEIEFESGDKDVFLELCDSIRSSLALAEITMPKAQRVITSWREKRAVKALIGSFVEELEARDARLAAAVSPREIVDVDAYSPAPQLLAIGSEIKDYLGAVDYTPAGIIALLKTDLFLAEQFEDSVGVWEGYSLEVHTEMMLEQFEKYFAGGPFPFSVNKEFLRLVFALHDIGKPAAVRNKDKHYQHKYTESIIQKGLTGLGYSNEEIIIARCLLRHDPLGEYFLGQPLKSVVGEFIQLASEAGLEVFEFLTILRIFYMCDSSSYTTDAKNGISSLEHLYHFSKVNNGISFSSERGICAKYAALERAILLETAKKVSARPLEKVIVNVGKKDIEYLEVHGYRVVSNWWVQKETLANGDIWLTGTLDLIRDESQASLGTALRNVTARFRKLIETDKSEPLGISLAGLAKENGYYHLAQPTRPENLFAVLKSGKLQPGNHADTKRYGDLLGNHEKIFTHLVSAGEDAEDIESIREMTGNRFPVLLFDVDQLLADSVFHLSVGYPCGKYIKFETSDGHFVPSAKSSNPHAVSEILAYRWLREANEVVFYKDKRRGSNVEIPLQKLTKIIVRKGEKAGLISRLREEEVDCLCPGRSWEELIEEVEPAFPAAVEDLPEVLEPYSGNSFEIVSYYLQGKGISPLEMINLMKREYRELAKELNAPSCKPRFDTKEEEYLGSFHDPRESSHTPLRVLSLLNKVLFGEDNDYLLKLYYGSMESSV